MRRLARASAILALLAATGARADEPPWVRDPACGVAPLVMRSGTLVYRLPHPFVRAGSDTVRTRGGLLVRGRDYVLDPLRGELRLLHEPAVGDTLWVGSCWLLAPPPLEFQLDHYRPPSPAADSVTLPSPPAPATGAAPTRAGSQRSPFSAPAGAALTLTGNKTLAVDFGSSQDAALRQSLDLAVSGSLAPGVTLTGVLSDRNTPLTSTGSTQDLQALDRVLIELKAPQASATLGDLTLGLEGGEFGRIERRLQGARGSYEAHGLQLVGAAASAQGEFRRMEFLGVEGRQGPYALTDRDGATGVAVVAGSEVVTLDGQRLTRGESADYFVDYERGEVTFTNKRLVTAQSRVTVDYQYAVNRFRRNLVAAGGRWERRAGWVFARALSEGDDQGRPLDLTLDAADRAVLAAAGDSASRAVGPGVTAGGGDYDTVRVSPTRLVYAYAGPDSGEFRVSFARVGNGSGDYADSTAVEGRTVFRYVGPGAGAFVIGRALPLPESHRLWVAGGGLHLGIATLEAEGAVSRFDRNTFSALDDGDDQGRAARVAFGLRGRVRGPLPGEASVGVQTRSVGRSFAPFARLEQPFAQEDWGVPLTADLERQDRVEATTRYALANGTTLRATAGRLRTLDGFTAMRRDAEWTRAGVLGAHALWERAEAERDGWRFRDGGRDHLLGELRWNGRWLEPAVRGEADTRRAPSDTGRVGTRFREGAFVLQSPRALRWRARVGLALRRDAQARATGFEDQTRARTWTGGLESPPDGMLSVTLNVQRRDVLPLAALQRTRSDLGSLRLRGQDVRRGLRGNLSLEITSEGENRRSRQVVFVGVGQGSYDSTGNLVGHGDYALVETIAPELDRVARAATSAATSLDFGSSEAWRGSRVEFAFESEARRRGALRGTDAFVSPNAVLGDPGLSRGSVLQRLEADLAPGSRTAAMHLRLERRVTADRQFVDFAQTVEDRQGTLRWRARPGAAVTTELESRLRRQIAEQRLQAGRAFQRTLLDAGGTGRLVVTPSNVLRLTAFGEAIWSRPAGQPEVTRTLRLGPDVGIALGARGRAELTARRAFIAGPPAVGLLPSADPAGAPQWESTARVDYRVRESTTLGVSMAARRFPERSARYDGRAELRAFF